MPKMCRYAGKLCDERTPRCTLSPRLAKCKRESEACVIVSRINELNLMWKEATSISIVKTELMGERLMKTIQPHLTYDKDEYDNCRRWRGEDS